MLTNKQQIEDNMAFDVFELGKTFYKVVPARETFLSGDIIRLSPNGDYLEYYTDPDGDEIEESNNIGMVEIKRIDTISVLGTTPEVHINSTIAYEDSGGRIWIDSALYDTIFC